MIKSIIFASAFALLRSQTFKITEALCLSCNLKT